MKVIIAGGTGFVGRRLCRDLGQAGHEAVVVSRTEGRPPEGAARVVTWGRDWQDELEGAGAVVNLCGAGVADARWTARRKMTLVDSRVQTTRRLVEMIGRARAKPEVLLNASAIGYYGDRGGERLSEASAPGGGFLPQLCLAWEAEAAKVEQAGVRSAIARVGVVLGRGGGALPKMLPPFRLGLGGPLGSGRQFLSWIHEEDASALLRFALARRKLRGAFNLTAPSPATNADFSRALARALGRPCVFRVPAFLLRPALGEMAELLLEGQRVEPAAALAAGFKFRFPELAPALADLL